MWKKNMNYVGNEIKSWVAQSTNRNSDVIAMIVLFVNPRIWIYVHSHIVN